MTKQAAVTHYKVQICVDLPGNLVQWGKGYWQPWFWKKYTSLRRALQAIPYAVASWPSATFRIVSCSPPLSNQQRRAQGLPPVDYADSVQQVWIQDKAVIA